MVTSLSPDDDCNDAECVHPPLPSDVTVRFNAGRMELYEQHADEPFISGKTVDLQQVR
jgi:hypothetical protein